MTRRRTVGLLCVALMALLSIVVIQQADDSQSAQHPGQHSAVTFEPENASIDSPPTSTTPVDAIVYAKAEPHQATASVGSRSDLPSSCTEQNLDYEPPLSRDALKSVRHRRKQRQQEAENLLRASTFSEHLTVSALLQEARDARIAGLKHALQSHPADVTTLWHAVNQCNSKATPGTCPQQDWEQRLIELDGQNSRVWALVASRRFESGDIDAAFQALTRAASSTETQLYTEHTARLYESAYASTGLLANSDRALLSIQSVWNQYKETEKNIEKLCVGHLEDNLEWAELCLAHADRVIVTANSIDNMVSAHRVRQLAMGQFGHAEEAEADYEAFRETLEALETRLEKKGELYEGALEANQELAAELIWLIVSAGELRGLDVMAEKLEASLPPAQRTECSNDNEP